VNSKIRNAKSEIRNKSKIQTQANVQNASDYGLLSRWNRGFEFREAIAKPAAQGESDPNSTRPKPLPKEREQQRSGLPNGKIVGFVRRLTTIPPLPWGEGWGEGKLHSSVAPSRSFAIGSQISDFEFS
jgi:hypothetical protein